MILPSVRAAISITNQLLLNTCKYCPEFVMISDESSDNELQEGISWDSWKESTSQKFLSRTIGLLTIPSDVAAMPYQRAVCYGYYPSYEVNSMQLIECKTCGAVLKEVGYGHHLRTRHARAKSPFSADECQTFLLSPPHVTSPLHCERSDSSQSFLKSSATYPNTLREEKDSNLTHLLPAQYSIEQRDDLKLALRVSRRGPSQPSGSNTVSTSKVEAPLLSAETHQVMTDNSNKKTANGKIKPKRKKKRRPESSSSDDLSLDHFRSKRRMDDDRRDLSLLPSTSSAIENKDDGPNNAFSTSVDGRLVEYNDESLNSNICADRYKSNESRDVPEVPEDRSSESPELLLSDLLASRKKTMQKEGSDLDETRLQPFSNSYMGGLDEEDDSVTCISETDKKGVLQSPFPLSPEESTQPPLIPLNEEQSYENGTSSASVTGEEEEPPVLKPEVYLTRPDVLKIEEEPLVVEACGSNTFVLSSKTKRKSLGKNSDIDLEKSPLFLAENRYSGSSSRSNCLFPPSTHSHISRSEINFSVNSESGGIGLPTKFPLMNEGEIIRRPSEAHSYDREHGTLSKSAYIGGLHSRRNRVSADPFLDKIHGDRELPVLEQAYCPSDMLDMHNELGDFASTSELHLQDAMNASTSAGSQTHHRESGSNIILTGVRRNGKENVTISKKQLPESQLRNQWNPNMKSLWRKGTHRVFRRPSAVKIDFSNVPRRRMILHKPEDVRYINTRVGVTKVMGAEVEYPEFQKRLSPFFCSEGMQYDPCSSTSGVRLIPTSDSVETGDFCVRGDMLPSSSYTISLPEEPSFLSRSGELLDKGVVDDVPNNSDDFCDDKETIDAISSDVGIVEERRQGSFMSRSMHIPGGSLPSTHYDSNQRTIHVLSCSDPQLSPSSPYFASPYSISEGLMAPTLYPQRSNMLLDQLSQDPEPKHVAGYEISRDDWEGSNISDDGRLTLWQTSRKVVETPPILKRMPSTSTEPAQLHDSMHLESQLPLSGSVKCLSRQKEERKLASDFSVLSSLVEAEDVEEVPLDGFGRTHNDGFEVAPGLQKSAIHRSSKSIVKPTILASGNKRYRLLPCTKGTSCSGSAVYTQAPHATIRFSPTNAPYVDARLLGRNGQETVVNGTFARSRRLCQKSTSVVPVLERYPSSSPQLSCMTSLCTVSPSVHSSQDSSCLSSLVPRTRMC